MTDRARRCDGRGWLVLRFSDARIPWRCPGCADCKGPRAPAPLPETDR